MSGRGFTCDLVGVSCLPSWVSVQQWSCTAGLVAMLNQLEQAGCSGAFWAVHQVNVLAVFINEMQGPHSSVLIVVFVAILSCSLATYTLHIQIYTLYTQLPTVFNVSNIYLLVILFYYF